MTTTNPLSRDELRKLRLARFAKKSTESDGSVKEEEDDDDDDDENQQPAKKKAKRAETKPKSPPSAAAAQDVIDLMDSSSDDEDIKEKTPSAAKKRSAASSKKLDNTKKNPSSNSKSTLAAPKKQVVEIDLWDDSDDEDDKEDPPQKPKAVTKRTTKTTSAHSSSSQTQTDSARKPDDKSLAFEIASYNLWFGHQGDGSPHVEARMEAIADLCLERTDPPLYFMGFQEVIPPISNALFPLLQSNGYRMVCQPIVSYGVALAVHPRLEVLDSGWQPYRLTRMARGFVYARCRLPNGVLCLVTNTHLESWTGKDSTGSTERSHQLNAMEDYCNKHMDQQKADIAMMMGDLNWDDTSKNPNDPVLDDVLSSIEWKDAWMTAADYSRKTADAKKGYTYDGKVNPMLGGNLRRRFDRCLVRGSRATIASTCLIGKEALPGMVYEKRNPYNGSVRKVPTAPSDHFGLVVQVQT